MWRLVFNFLSFSNYVPIFFLCPMELPLWNGASPTNVNKVFKPYLLHDGEGFFNVGVDQERDVIF